jgi:uncharacterized protein (TIGR03437 family)
MTASGLFAQTEPLAGGINIFRAFRGLSIRTVLADNTNAIIVTGTTTTTGLPVTPDAFQADYKYSSCGSVIGPFPSPARCPNIYIARLAEDGSLLFGTYLGSTGGVTLVAAALNADGDLYLLGNTAGADLPLPLASGRPPGTFVLRLKGGSKLILARLLPFAQDVTPSRLALDRNNNIYIAGDTFGSLAATPGAFQTTSGGLFDGFVMKLTPPADEMLWATYLGGRDFDRINDMLVDSGGNVYVTGSSQSSDFPTTPGAWVQVAPPTPLQSPIFVTILDPTGSRLIASSRFGGENSDYATALALSPSGEVLVAGTTTSDKFPITVGALQTTKLDLTTVFLTKLKPDLSAPIFSTYLGGESSDYVNALIVQPDGSIIVQGNASSRFFPVTSNALERCSRTLGWTSSVGFLTRINPDGSRVVYSSFLGFHDFGSALLGATSTADGRMVLIGDGPNGYDLSYYGGPVGTDAAQMVFRLDPETAPQRSRFCVVNSASFVSGFASPNELITLFGAGIGPDVSAQGLSGSPRIGTTRVLVNGAPAQLLYADKQQVNALLPAGFGVGATRVDLEKDGVILESTTLRYSDTDPGLFRDIGFATAAASNEDGTKNSREHPATRGSRLTLYGTGFGAQPVHIYFGPQEALVLSEDVIAIQVRVPDTGEGLKLVPVNFQIGFEFRLGNVSVWVE